MNRREAPAIFKRQFIERADVRSLMLIIGVTLAQPVLTIGNAGARDIPARDETPIAVAVKRRPDDPRL